MHLPSWVIYPLRKMGLLDKLESSIMILMGCFGTAVWPHFYQILPLRLVLQIE
jgi:hypothetical protein